MTPAYDERDLEYAMDNLGTAVDYAVNKRKVPGQMFLEMFVNSGIALEFSNGNPMYTCGMSGKQMADIAMERCGLSCDEISEFNGDYTPEYWCGWILAYCQWKLNITFKKMFYVLTYDDFINTYNVLHEASKEKAFSVFFEKLTAQSFLARMRLKSGLTQAQLAKKSGVSLRSIQLYEQKVNDINKAQYNSLKSLADVLCCPVEDITEP